MSTPIANAFSTINEPLLASPSKYRAAAITARNWSTVTTWLTQLFSPSPVPPFERNDATLAYLLSVVHANDAADAEHDLLHRAKVEALDEVQAVKAKSAEDIDPTQVLTREIESSLSSSGQSSLDSLAESAAALGLLPPYNTSAMAASIIALTHSHLTTQQHAERLSSLQKQLEREIHTTQQAIAELRSSAEDESTAASLRAQTALWTRETKQLALKAAEYKDRLVSLERWSDSLSGPLFSDVRMLEDRIEERQRGVKALEEQMLRYHDLPPDVEVAREEIRRAQGELGALRDKREELFGRMVEQWIGVRNERSHRINGRNTP